MQQKSNPVELFSNPPITLQDTLLLVEDNPDDIFLMRRALKKSGVEMPLQVVTDGKQAIDYLRGGGTYSDREQFPRPALVFLDLKLPYVNGFEVLEWIRSDAANRNLEVIILTSSPETRDRETAAALGARAYLVKPPTPESLLGIFQQVTSSSPQFSPCAQA